MTIEEIRDKYSLYGDMTLFEKLYANGVIYNNLKFTIETPIYPLVVYLKEKDFNSITKEQMIELYRLGYQGIYQF